jgi:hypothetical protein
MDVRVRPVEPWTSDGDYMGDPAFRARFQDWLAGLWRQKDELLTELLGPAGWPADFRPLDF